MVMFRSLLALSSAGVALANYNYTMPSIWDDVKVRAVRHVGDGCPGETIQGYMANNGHFTVAYEALNAVVQGGQPRIDLECYIEVDIETTASLQVIVQGGTFRGHVSLSENAWAQNVNNITWKDSGLLPFHTEQSFSGPREEDINEFVYMETEIASGCGTGGGVYTLQVVNTISVAAEANGSGAISVCELDGAVYSSYKLSTSICP